MTSDSTQSIHRSALRFSAGTLVSRSTGLLRDMAMAYAFGTEPLIALFMVAFRFSHLMRRLFGEGSLQNTFIPHFESLRQTSLVSALAFFRNLKASLCLVLIAFIALGAVLMAAVRHWAPLTATHSSLLALTSLMLPSLLFICLFGLNAALLACEKSFFIAGAAPVAFNLIWVAAALMLATAAPGNAVFGMSLAVIAACAAQWMVTLPATFSILKQSGTLPPIQLFSSEVRQLAVPLFLANVGVAASQINNALDPLFALYANPEGPAWLWFAIRIQQLPISLFAIALSSALLPPIARAIKSNRMQQASQFYYFAIRRLSALTIPFSFAIAATAASCINLLFGHGQFQLDSVAGSSLCLLAYSAGLFPMAYILIGAPTLFAFGDFKKPTRGALISMGVSTILNVIFIFLWKAGPSSVAWSTSIAAFFNAYYLKQAIDLQMEVKPSYASFSFALTLLSSLCASAAVFLTDYLVLGKIPLWNLLNGQPLPLSQELAAQIALFGMEGFAFVSTLIASAYLFNAQDILGWLNKRQPTL